MKPGAHVAIAGAGLLGRLLAWQLLEKGCRVNLYEAGSLTRSTAAAHTAAGMIAPISEAIDTELLMYQMGAAALEIWPQWLAELASVGTVDYNVGGSLILAHPRDHSLLTQYVRDMQHRLPVDAQGKFLDRQTLRALEPDIAEHFRHGLWLTGEAHIDNRALLTVLLKRAQALGCACFEHTSVSIADNRLIADDVANTFDLVLDCRGVGAKDAWREVRGVRGEILRVVADEVTLQRPVRLLHPRYQLYVVPAPNRHFIIGATQIESEDHSPMSVQSCLELCSALYTINPAFAEARIVELTANLRPALNDNRPRISWSRGLARINGLYRHGYLLAPTIVSHIMSALFDRAPSKPIRHHPTRSNAGQRPLTQSHLANTKALPFAGVLDHFIQGASYADCID